MRAYQRGMHPSCIDRYAYTGNSMGVMSSKRHSTLLYKVLSYYYSRGCKGLWDEILEISLRSFLITIQKYDTVWFIVFNHTSYLFSSSRSAMLERSLCFSSESSGAYNKDEVAIQKQINQLGITIWIICNDSDGTCIGDCLYIVTVWRDDLRQHYYDKIN